MQNDLQKILGRLQTSLGEKFPSQLLQLRKIPQKVGELRGLGYAEFGKWPHFQGEELVEQWKFGRLVFPCTDPSGKLVNLCGRAVVSDPKGLEDVSLYDFALESTKGVFNGRALTAETVYLCASPFDALSLMAAGIKNVCAVFSPDNLDCSWVKAKKVIFCIHPDKMEPWKKASEPFLKTGIKRTLFPPKAYLGKYETVNQILIGEGKLPVFATPTSKKEEKTKQEKKLPSKQESEQPTQQTKEKPSKPRSTQKEEQPSESQPTQESEKKPEQQPEKKEEQATKEPKSKSNVAPLPQKEPTKQEGKENEQWDEKQMEELLQNTFTKIEDLMHRMCMPWHEKHNPKLMQKFTKCIEDIDLAMRVESAPETRGAVNNLKSLVVKMIAVFAEQYLSDDNIIAS